MPDAKPDSLPVVSAEGGGINAHPVGAVPECCEHDCELPASVRGWCRLHYRRWARRNPHLISRRRYRWAADLKGDVDEVAIQRACDGDQSVVLTTYERRQAVGLLRSKGCGYREIAERLGVPDRYVERDLRALRMTRIRGYRPAARDA